MLTHPPTLILLWRYQRMTIYHNHHIIPRHAGGADEPSNIARLTTEQHAEAHKKLYAEYGRWQDRLAWHGLAGLVGKDDLVREAHQLKGPKVSAAKRSKFASGETVIWNKGKTGVYNEETLEKMRGSKSDTHVENMRKSFKDRDISNMGRHKRTEAMKQKQREAAKKQWTPEARAAHSKRMKEVRKANSFSS